ncbi:MAG TPA: dihydrolipoamide acetyltransferase family protein [Gammaproteobacteria bacterium]|jgi:2-oxoglutarate dehydrogenase E2 component (dihydrolipoamide succinyltransferase)
MDVLMPQLGETVTEGTVAGWRKQVGDRVAADEILLDIETDKVSMEVPAPQAGVLAKILVETGQTVGVGTVLAVIDAEGAQAVEEPTVRAPAVAAPASGAPPAAKETPAPSRAAVRAPTADRSDTQRLSPAVRRLVAEYQIDVQAVAGTGRHGRVTRRNIMEHLEQRAEPPVRIPLEAPRQRPPNPAESSLPRSQAPAPAEPTARRKAAPEPRPQPAPPPAAGTTVPFTRIRRLTAEHMVKSKATSPHVLQAVEVDFTGVERVRQAHRDSWRAQHGYSLTYLPFIAHAVCRALGEFPNLNASVEGDALLLHPRVNLAIAVDLGAEGLIAPVIKGAEALAVPQLAGAIHDIAGRARASKLKPDDLADGTYTLSNSGSFGTLITAPIINQPQVAILSIDGVRKKPVVIERPDGDSIAVRLIGILAQSFDHRAVDGAYSAAFLDRVRKHLELTDWFREI